MTVRITATGLRRIAPSAAPFIVEGVVNHQEILIGYGIDTPRRMRHFLARSAVETAGFRRLVENLNYTTTTRLKAVWPSRFRSDAAARPYVGNPEKLANFVYGGRLGNTAPGDGWKYRGRGMKQTTGRANYAEVEDETGLPVTVHPELLERFPEALISAGVFWRNRNINRLADADDIEAICRIVQGGTGGLADQRVYYSRALKVDFGAEPAASTTTGTVTATTLNLRDGPEGDVIGKLPKGARVVIIGSRERWLKVVTSSGKTGWAHGGYIDIE